MALLDNGRGAFCRIKVHRNLNITHFVHALRRPSRARAESFAQLREPQEPARASSLVDAAHADLKFQP
jgi:hypothetical protein